MAGASTSSSNMFDKQPPSNDEIKKLVQQHILRDPELRDAKVIPMTAVCQQVYSHFPEFDLRDRQPFIKDTIKAVIRDINMEPNIAQMETLVKFLEENPDLAAEPTNEEYVIYDVDRKWEAVTKEINLLGRRNRSCDYWVEFWEVLRSYLLLIVAERKSKTGSPGRSLKAYPEELVERMLTLLERIEKDAHPDESPSTSQAQDPAQQTDDDTDDDSDPEPSTSEPATSSGSEAVMRNRRSRAKAMRPSPVAKVQKFIRIEEGRLQINLKSAEVLNKCGATPEKLGFFIAACGQRIAAEIQRRNTLN